MAEDRKYTDKEVSDWMMGKARSAAGYRRNIVEREDRAQAFTSIGRMYFFWYDPKHKKTLPIYDRFPLVFPIERYQDGFLGLNLHYLTQGERRALLMKLYSYRTSQQLTPRTKLQLSYDLIQSTRKLSTLARPCIKRYLYTHVRSRFIEVIAEEWDRAIELPVEFWVQKK